MLEVGRRCMRVGWVAIVGVEPIHCRALRICPLSLGFARSLHVALGRYWCQAEFREVNFWRLDAVLSGKQGPWLDGRQHARQWRPSLRVSTPTLLRLLVSYGVLENVNDSFWCLFKLLKIVDQFSRWDSRSVTPFCSRLEFYWNTCLSSIVFFNTCQSMPR